MPDEFDQSLKALRTFLKLNEAEKRLNGERMNDGLKALPMDPTKWQVKDLKALATGDSLSAAHFHDILAMCNLAVNDQSPYQIKAQAALGTISKDGDWKNMYGLVVEFLQDKDAVKEYKEVYAIWIKEQIKYDQEKQEAAKRAQDSIDANQSRPKATGKIIPKSTHSATKNKTAFVGTDMVDVIKSMTLFQASADAPIFDQQTALATLDAHKVTLDKVHDLKSPEVSRAMDFVKAAKGIAA